MLLDVILNACICLYYNIIAQCCEVIAYYLRMKSVLDSDQTEFMMDMIEFCPKEVYDNPNEPEDIW